jgi:2-polyprenyl-3-methyl-5-hydroxy-6-metoxy-1,4-benzoquinol methylase
MLISLRKTLTSYKDSQNRTKKAIYRILHPLNLLVYLFKSLLNEKSRNDVIRPLLTKRKLRHYLQEHTTTSENRYPDLFKISQNYFSINQENTDYLKKLCLLSYGCSTGEEVKTLNDYFPGAQITGVDVNKWCVQKAQQKYKNNNFTFLQNVNGIENIFCELQFDAIFALSVLQHTINRSSNNDFARKVFFQDFERKVTKFNKILKPGGLLVIENTDFNFLNTKISSSYYPLDVQGNLIKTNRPVFDVNNKKIGETFLLFRVFVKK